MLFNFGSPAETFGGVIDPDAPYLHYSQRGSNRRTRVLGRRDSQDFLNWSGLRTVIEQDLLDPPGTEFYSAGFDPINRTDGGLHVLMLHTFQTDLSEPYGIAGAERYWGAGETGSAALPARVDGFVETQLAVSRDTVSWDTLPPAVHSTRRGWRLGLGHGLRRWADSARQPTLVLLHGGQSDAQRLQRPALARAVHDAQPTWQGGRAPASGRLCQRRD